MIAQLQQKPTPPPDLLGPLLDRQQHTTPGKSPRLLCVHCETRIASPSDRIEIEGKALHIFTNPAGFVYRIGCFAEATNLHEEGPPIRQHTWFAGYAWTITRCKGCSLHLGWHYLGGQDTFFGLILTRLLERDEGCS